MFIARWQIDARFGHKQRVIDMLKAWDKEVGDKVGMPHQQDQLLTGSIGAREATVEHNVPVESLAKLEEFFEAIGKMDAHRQWGTDLEPYVVSGSSRWKIFRVL